MPKLIGRRLVIGGLVSSAGLLTTGCKYADMAPTFGALFKAGDLASYHAQSFLLSQQSMAREFSAADRTPDFPVVGTKLPKDGEYRRQMAQSFQDWRLPVTGLVERPGSFSLAELMALPSRTQVTTHSCQEGWTAIGQWTGVQLARVLSTTGLKPNARFVFFHAADGWYDSVHLFDALHPQTLLAYGMNGGPLPIAHGAPVRLRVERHLGYKSIKFVKRIEVVESLAEVGNGLGSSGAAYGFSWNSGI